MAVGRDQLGDNGDYEAKVKRRKRSQTCLYSLGAHRRLNRNSEVVDATRVAQQMENRPSGKNIETVTEFQLYLLFQWVADEKSG